VDQQDIGLYEELLERIEDVQQQLRRLAAH